MKVLTTALQWIKKRWYVLLVLLIVAGAGAGIANKYYFRPYYMAIKTSMIGQQACRQVSLDLIYLEKAPNAKITPDQAKEILPLVEEMSGSTDPALQVDLAKQIYGMLTPVQYATLVDSNRGISGSLSNGRDLQGKQVKGRQEKTEGDFRDFKVSNRKDNNPLQQALGSVVTKMLTERSQEKPATNPQ